MDIINAFEELTKCDKEWLLRAPTGKVRYVCAVGHLTEEDKIHYVRLQGSDLSVSVCQQHKLEQEKHRD